MGVATARRQQAQARLRRRRVLEGNGASEASLLHLGARRLVRAWPRLRGADARSCRIISVTCTARFGCPTAARLSRDDFTRGSHAAACSGSVSAASSCIVCGGDFQLSPWNRQCITR
jgi:hypothetical protein